MGQGFQFTPMGLRPIGDSSGIDTTVQHGGVIPPRAVEADESEVAHVAQCATPAVRGKPGVHERLTVAAINPRAVIKAARSRVKEIRAELRRMRGLQKELGQLERMLAAASKPLASLTPITSRRAG